MDIIGKIYAPTDKMVTDEEGNEWPEMAEVAGWHVNYWKPVAEWEDYVVTPSSPSRMYAGHETFYYRFADEAEFIAKAKEAGLWAEPVQEMAEDASVEALEEPHVWEDGI